MDIFLYDKMNNCQDVGREFPLFASLPPPITRAAQFADGKVASCMHMNVVAPLVGISTILMPVVHPPRAVRKAMQKSLGILEDAIRLFGPECVYASFNGGKDAVVILHLCE